MFDIKDVEDNLNSEMLHYFRGERDGYVQVGEKKWFLPVKYKKLAEAYKNFEVRSDDVWIIGYPRSGTSLTEELTWLLTHNLDYEGVKDYRAQFFENNLVLNEKTVKEIIEKFPNEEDIIQKKKNSLELLRNEKKRRVIKTHLPFELLPEDVFKKGCKIIYICRYPKDVAVSYFFLQSSIRHIDFCGDLSKFWQYFRNGNTMFGPYFDHVEQGFKRIGSKNFLFIFYEEFRKNMSAFIRKLTEFLEITLSEEDLTKLKNYMDFENYRKKEINVKDKDNNPVNFCRKGVVGGWKEHFSEIINEEAESWIKMNAERIGIKYPEMK
ncbi:sulfotransferase 1 family member D1-like [Harmonia axyridis]|uniref:sulfotransferase 1 family member D1-like n=1 Tax=Harmonia axyridis TaxID=115357 RepID=UPI001E279B84|nr:sulfotransferase 1 family member D1-like [Harmonia axyridis]